MARATPKRCRQSGCGKTTIERHGYCDTHASNASWGKYGKQQTTKGKRVHHSSEWKYQISPHIKDLANHLCINCLLSEPSRVVQGVITEHIVPVSKGGTEEYSNLSCFCRECATIKTSWERNRTVSQILNRYGHTAITKQSLKQ
jgi:5-methylcytosine-specific restriction protein A